MNSTYCNLDSTRPTGSRCLRSVPEFAKSESIAAESIGVLYGAKFEEGVHVLHAFEKKTRKTTKADLEVAGSRLRKLLKIRRAENKS